MLTLKGINLLKRKWSLIFMSTIMFLLLFGAISASNYKVLAAETRTINVTGDGEVNVVPDIANLSLGVTTEDSTIDKAQQNNSAAINKVVEAIKAAGVAAEDIKTSNYYINPKYNYNEETGISTIIGYTVDSTLNVTVKNIASVGTVIDTAVANGANNSNGVTFGVGDYEKYYNKALTNAILNAKAKAQAIADALDVKLSTLTTITENSNGIPGEYPIFYDSSSVKNSGGQGTTIETGLYKIKANVSLVYQY
ncbi:SIMPL domain-containing protein [Clostridium kluyveri]|uniref:SIMPL domain-containing protein n=1 Tax=Clostridium kluyveri TaxID=1534 RepID=UPI002246DA9B|nr:SIMPL domain-containing protein [Clostridium kluyveri]UZQ50145.1 SIMPL domain-containing protein [Clostridium kluyveri]